MFYCWSDLYLEGGFDRLFNKPPRPKSVWDPIPDDRHDDLIVFIWDDQAFTTRELAVKYTDEKHYFASETSTYRVLKEVGWITALDYVVIKAADEFTDKTTAINQKWQTSLAYIKVLVCDGICFSTVLDACGRYIVS
ncbi:MAG: helix-turn-helix domain-containing protein [Sulfitobacter sp.]